MVERRDVEFEVAIHLRGWLFLPGTNVGAAVVNAFGPIRQVVAHMRAAHGVCDEHGDVATASLLEVWIDEAEKRVWYLFEASRRGDAPGR